MLSGANRLRVILTLAVLNHYYGDDESRKPQDIGYYLVSVFIRSWKQHCWWEIQSTCDFCSRDIQLHVYFLLHFALQLLFFVLLGRFLQKIVLKSATFEKLRWCFRQYQSISFFYSCIRSFYWKTMSIQTQGRRYFRI